MKNNQVISESFIQKICSFFVKREYCRGYDLDSPIGKIANRAFNHWNDVERKEEEIKNLNDRVKRIDNLLVQLNTENKSLSNDLIYYKNKFVKSLDTLKNLYKVKWSETDPLKWNEPRLEDKVIHKERIFSAESLKEAQEIANLSFRLCQFYLYRYNEELGDFDEEHNLQFAVEENGKILVY